MSTKTRIRAVEPETIPFVLMRIAYIYVWGKEKNSPLPVFFKPNTRTKIRRLRQNYGNKEVAFGNKFTSLKEFEKELEDETQKGVFGKLREAIGREISGGTGSFLNACWCKAITS